MAVNIKIVIIINILSEKRPPTHKAAPKIQPTLAFCKQKQFLGLTNRLELWWRTHAWLWKLNTDILDQGLWNSCMEMWGHHEAVLIRYSVVGGWTIMEDSCLYVHPSLWWCHQVITLCQTRSNHHPHSNHTNFATNNPNQDRVMVFPLFWGNNIHNHCCRPCNDIQLLLLDLHKVKYKVMHLSNDENASLRSEIKSMNQCFSTNSFSSSSQIQLCSSYSLPAAHFSTIENYIFFPENIVVLTSLKSSKSPTLFQFSSSVL